MIVVMKVKKYCFYWIREDFLNLFNGDNLNAFLELYFRKEESNYYKNQFDIFVKNLDMNIISDILKDKFLIRKDFIIEGNKYILNNYITSNKEILVLKHNCIEVTTDYEVSPFINTLSDNFPDLIEIDENNCKIGRIGLVSSSKIR